MKKLIRIDDALLEAIQKNAETIGNSTTKEINEMLWLALKPRSEQIKKVMATRAITMGHLNNKTRHEKTKAGDVIDDYEQLKIDEILDNL